MIPKTVLAKNAKTKDVRNILTKHFKEKLEWKRRVDILV